MEIKFPDFNGCSPLCERASLCMGVGGAGLKVYVNSFFPFVVMELQLCPIKSTQL